MTATTHNNPEALLGLRIMTLLHRQQKSVYALAKQAGLPVKTVQRICKGEGKQPSVWTIAAMARVLGVSMDDLVALPDREGTPATPYGRVGGLGDWSWKIVRSGKARSTIGSSRCSAIIL